MFLQKDKKKLEYISEHPAVFVNSIHTNMKKFALLTALLVGVAADEGGTPPPEDTVEGGATEQEVLQGPSCTEKVLNAKSDFTLTMTDLDQIKLIDPTAVAGDTYTATYKDEHCYKVVIGHDAWRVVYRNEDGIDDCSRPETNTDGDVDADGNLILLSGGFDVDGNPEKDSGFHTITYGKTYLGQPAPETIIQATGPEDIVEGLADRFKCKDCAHLKGYTGAEALVNGTCILTADSVKAYIDQIKGDLVQADLDAIKSKLDTLFPDPSTDATAAADAVYTEITAILTTVDKAHLGEVNAAIQEKITALETANQNLQRAQNDLTAAETNAAAAAEQAILDQKAAVAGLNTTKNAEIAALNAAHQQATTAAAQDAQTALEKAVKDAEDSKDAFIQTLRDNHEAAIAGKNATIAGHLAEIDSKAGKISLLTTQRDTLQGSINTVSGILSDFSGATAEERAGQADILHGKMQDLIQQAQGFTMQLHTTIGGVGGGIRTVADKDDLDEDGSTIDDLVEKLKQDYGTLSSHATGVENDFKNFKETPADLISAYKNTQAAAACSWE